MNLILFSDEDKHSSEYFFTKNDERYRHIKKILKLKTGDNFKAGIINGNIGTAKIESFNEEKIVFSFAGQSEPEPLHPINMVLGFPRPIQLRRILRDISSIGVSKIFLTGTESGEKSYRDSNLSKESEIKKYLLDGCAQSGNPIIPEVFISDSISVFFSIYGNLLKPKDIKLFFDLERNAAPLPEFKNTGNTIWFAIGSERGWTNLERLEFKKRGFKTISLGNRILRTETAAAAALSYILTKAGIYT